MTGLERRIGTGNSPRPVNRLRWGAFQVILGGGFVELARFPDRPGYPFLMMAQFVLRSGELPDSDPLSLSASKTYFRIGGPV